MATSFCPVLAVDAILANRVPRQRPGKGLDVLGALARRKLHEKQVPTFPIRPPISWALAPAHVKIDRRTRHFRDGEGTARSISTWVVSSCVTERQPDNRPTNSMRFVCGNRTISPSL